jgi:glycosyltransferase involved in cell wall biosynthesis
MNIGFDAKRAFSNRSGLGNYSRSTIRLLSDFYPGNKYFLFSKKDEQNLIQHSENQFIIEPGPGISSSFPSIWRSWGIYNEIKNNKLDIYHGLSNELPLSIKKTGAKSVVTIHDLIFLRFPEYYPFIDRQIYFHKFSNACRIADKIIAVSEATKQDIISFLGISPDRIDVVYQTCDPVFRTKVTSERKAETRAKYCLPENFILYLGTIEKRKNALNLIKAYLEQNIEIPLVIVGKPTAFLTEIKEYLKQHQRRESILFRHTVESRDIPSIYQSAQVFVYPSVFEGFGIPILEALYSGVPVITSTGSCFHETGGDAALYCDHSNIGEMGKCITDVLNSEDTRKSMIEKGFLHARKFDEEKVAANLMGVYMNLLQ